jgi:hypothetical protein
VLALVLASGTGVWAWASQGHRLVALLAEARLTPAARQTVAWLLDNRSLADVANWADTVRDDETQTGPWHYVNIPADARGYNRSRDCPVQPGVRAGTSADTWRDCVVDRILVSRDRLANTRLDRADRATALKYLVHLVGDLHQPFHAYAEARGGNGVSVSLFGSPKCRRDDGTQIACNLHGVWDGALIAHRNLDDRRYLAALENLIATRGLASRAATGSPADWAMRSHDLARAAWLEPGGHADEAYYRAQIGVIDEQLALAGLRLAAIINASL